MSEQNKSQNKSENKQPVSKEKQLIFYKSLTIILMLVVLVVLGRWGYDKYIEMRANKMYDEMVAKTAPVSATEQLPQDTQSAQDTQTQAEEVQLPEDINIPQKNLDWNELSGTNNDIYAWICIPNTQVDYPILQSKDDDSYYLTHNIDGSKGYPGCIYTEKVNYRDFFDFNTVIYGHNMKNGAMFKTLHNFEDKDFFKQNKYIYIYTPEDTYVYEIFDAYTGDDAHILNTNDFSKEAGRQAYLDNVRTRAGIAGNIRDDVEVNTESKIITLSTCTGNSSQRYLVQAVRLN